MLEPRCVDYGILVRLIHILCRYVPRLRHAVYRHLELQHDHDYVIYPSPYHIPMVHGKCQASVSRGRANGQGPSKLPKMPVFRKKYNT